MAKTGIFREEPKRSTSRRRLTIVILLAVVVVGAMGLELTCRALYYQRHAGEPIAIVKAVKSLLRDDSHDVIEPPAAGRWFLTSTREDAEDLTEEQRREIIRLNSIGYLPGSQPPLDARNVTVNERDFAFDGLNLVVSGHASEAILVDMNGRELHKWQCDKNRAFPDLGEELRTNHQYTCWRRAHLMPNGDMLAIFGGLGIVKLDKDSNVIWSKRNNAHHDVHVASDGRIYLLGRAAHVNKRYHDSEPVLEDYLVVLDPDGRELERFSLFDALADSPFAAHMRRGHKSGDIFHTNTIELIEGPVPEDSSLRSGTVLISIRELDLLCAVDTQQKQVYWAEAGLWHRQHQSTLLPDGRIMLFDNKGVDRQSRVLEFNPVTRRVDWMYGDEQHPFFSPTCGSAQRLPNGNTLITESDPGRAFEVTPDQKIVWEYVSPYRAGEEEEFVATLFEIVRIPRQYTTAWLSQTGDMIQLTAATKCIADPIEHEHTDAADPVVVPASSHAEGHTRIDASDAAGDVIHSITLATPAL
ncbi:MAG: hypothetical protein CMJ49_00965 [Planctomycetaceae bacterium]|nr:hypothetical protein [Planctomycetaceae bacterium]